MAVLSNHTRNEKLLSDLKIAKTFFSRARGLLGTQGLAIEQGLWIHRCNSIHTFGMNYSIACVFLDKSMKIVSVLPEVKPWRIVGPQRGAKSVIELTAKHFVLQKIQIGDELHVGS